MSKGKIFVSLITSIISFPLFSQTITIESFEEEKDVIFGETITDSNGSPCAMIVVDIPEVEDMHFRGSIVDDVIYDDGEYYFYVPQGTKQIRFSHEDYYPGSISFGKPVVGNTIYRASLRPDNLVVDGKSSWLVLNVKDSESNPISNCSVLVDEEEFQTDEKGALELYLEAGEHDYVVSNLGYSDYNQSVTLTDMPMQCTVIMLQNQDTDLLSSRKTRMAFTESEVQKLSWFLADKMTHDLNLTDLQSQDVYEINYDFLHQVKPVGNDLEPELNMRYRNLSLVLDETQWMRYQATDYFMNPLSNEGNAWNLAVFSVYDSNQYFGRMTSQMKHYAGENAACVHYYQARGLGYRDEVNAHMASVSLSAPKPKPFSKKLIREIKLSNTKPEYTRYGIQQRTDPKRIRENSLQYRAHEEMRNRLRTERLLRRREESGRNAFSRTGQRGKVVPQGGSPSRANRRLPGGHRTFSSEQSNMRENRQSSSRMHQNGSRQSNKSTKNTGSERSTRNHGSYGVQRSSSQSERSQGLGSRPNRSQGSSSRSVYQGGPRMGGRR